MNRIQTYVIKNLKKLFNCVPNNIKKLNNSPYHIKTVKN